jgi:acid stress-induced BolA-like protein IbaG/YrbA
VNRVLQANLAGYVSALEQVPETGRIMGFVVSSAFTDLSDRKRQRLLNKLLYAALDRQELLRVGPIVTMTPDEASVHEEVE